MKKREIIDKVLCIAVTCLMIGAMRGGLASIENADRELHNIESLVKILEEVPYIHQTYDTPDDFVGSWACAPTSAVMVLAYYGRISPNPIWVSYPSPGHYSDYGRYISKEYTHNGYTFSNEHTENTPCGVAVGKGAWGYIWQDSSSSCVSCGVITNLQDYLRLHDFLVSYAHYDEDSAKNLVQQEIDNGRPLIARTYLTDGGHYVVVVGYEIDAYGNFGYKVNDPFGDEPYGSTCWGDYNVQQPVSYSYSEMGLGNPTRGLITIQPISGEPSPCITSSLRIVQSPPYYVGDTITARFTIANKGTASITFDVLTVGGRDPDDQVADFTFRRDVTLNPSESYDYEGTLTLAKEGGYHFFCAYQTPDGNWNTAIPTEGGATNTLDITVTLAAYSVTVYVQGFSSTYSTKVYLDGNDKGIILGGGSKTFADLTGSHTINVEKYVSGPIRTRYCCPSNSWSFSSGGSHTFNYHTQYYLTVNSNPSGTDNPRPSGWYDECTTVTIQCDTPAPCGTDCRYVFTHWSGDCSGTSTSTIVHIDRPKICTANYKRQYYLTLNSNPSGIDNPRPSGWYDEGTSVTVQCDSPVPAGSSTRWLFTHWSGDASGTSPTSSVYLNEPKTATANYKRQYQLTIDKVGQGTTDPSPSTYWYDQTSTVEVTAYPDSGWKLDYWMLDDANVGSNPSYTVTMDKDHTLKAYFIPIECVVTFYTDPIGSTYNITFDGKTYTNDQTDVFNFGTHGSATANSPSGWKFLRWETTSNVEVSSTTANPTTITINCGGTLKAVFQAMPDLVVTDVQLPYPDHILYEGIKYNIGVTVKNIGLGSAGSFNVSLQLYWVKGSLIDYYGEITVLGLASGENVTVYFQANTNHVTDYMLTATADCNNDVTECDETNNKIEMNIRSRCAGDIDGDGKVGHEDLLLLAGAYGSREDKPNYIPEADINCDGKIDHPDLLILAGNYGKEI